MSYQLIDFNHPQRQAVERFICERYWVHFNACLNHLPQRLIAVFEGTQIVAACGMQLAEEGPLFSEYYLSKPLEQRRQKLAEVGSMAVLSGNYLQPLFVAIHQAAHDLQRQYLLFTVTRFLQLKLKRLGIQAQTLAPAYEQALPETLQNLWGNYYQQQPQVFMAAVQQRWGRTPGAHVPSQTVPNQAKVAI
ncbi:thermostable hemolysin [Pseudidiomarina woesei]|uniref:Thermostable hemolysin n=1 Tax=Pseudidiomarina woesei TaxID=1381080 RepID=A0A0K6H2W0_9GAMM|nr:thermostable hemolysin [Pseudidiomarina woesei]CUA85230.1 Thermostable hemolysin [Pseudidiomarina woesei]